VINDRLQAFLTWLWTHILQIVKNKQEKKEKKKAVFTWDIYVKPKSNCLAIIYHVSSCNGPYVVFFHQKTNAI
jgi:hypothetical protein